MEKLKVNPTRMELRRLKTRLKTAERGHKLLKDKADEMVRQFMIFIKENKRLREATEAELKNAMQDFMLAKAISDEAAIQEAVVMSGTAIAVECGFKNVMSVNVPQFKLEVGAASEKFPYSFTDVTGELDESIAVISDLLEKLLRLAEVEKTCNMLAVEIEKNRRRVNALEYVMIPQIKETIKFITMKLEENERGNIVRLMKVKDIIAERN